MAVLLDPGFAASALDAALVNLNNTGGPTAGYFELRTGAAPSGTTGFEGGTLLATLPFATPANAAFGAAAGNPPVATADVTAGWVAQDTSPVASGTVGHWRLYDYTGGVRAQGSVGLVGSGADIEFTSLNIVAGVLVRLTAMTITLNGVT